MKVVKSMMFNYEQCKDNYHLNINPLGSIFKTLKLLLNFNYKINKQLYKFNDQNINGSTKYYLIHKYNNVSRPSNL